MQLFYLFSSSSSSFIRVSKQFYKQHVTQCTNNGGGMKFKCSPGFFSRSPKKTRGKKRQKIDFLSIEDYFIGLFIGEMALGQRGNAAKPEINKTIKF